MQTTNKELDVPVSPMPTEPESDDLHLTPEEADEIFRLAEAEIKPLLRHAAREKWIERVQAAICLCMMLAAIIGIVYETINYPKTTVTLFPVERSTSITTALDVPLKTLAPVTLIRSATAQTTGHGHQNARTATGILTFYNGQSNPQTIPIGTVFTGHDGVRVTTYQTVIVPAANLPAIGVATVPARAIVTGSQGNIAAFDMNISISSDLKVKNEARFTNGEDARDYRVAARRDLDSLTATTTQIVNQEILRAFTLHPDEALRITNCKTKTTADHVIGEEAQTVTVKTVKTCAAVAYSQNKVTKEATAVFTTETRPAGYHLMGSIQTNVTSVAPFQVRLTGIWVYTITSTYEQYLAEKIAGDTPAQAKSYLLKTGSITLAIIPHQLPKDPEYIRFFVLVG